MSKRNLEELLKILDKYKAHTEQFGGEFTLDGFYKWLKEHYIRYVV